jgi:hypothetical protein
MLCLAAMPLPPRIHRLWNQFAHVILAITLMVLPRGVVAGSSDIDPGQFRDGDFRVSRWAWVWPLVVIAIGLFLLAPYQQARRGWVLTKLIGLAVACLGGAACWWFRRLRVTFSNDTVHYQHGQESHAFPLSGITTVYSTPGYIHVLGHDGARVEIPKVFARGALLLAMLREHRPAGTKGAV